MQRSGSHPCSRRVFGPRLPPVYIYAFGAAHPSPLFGGMHYLVQHRDKGCELRHKGSVLELWALNQYEDSLPCRVLILSNPPLAIFIYGTRLNPCIIYWGANWQWPDYMQTAQAHLNLHRGTLCLCQKFFGCLAVQGHCCKLGVMGIWQKYTANSLKHFSTLTLFKMRCKYLI